MSKKRDLSPASTETNQRTVRQKSISDVIAPMVDQCRLDLANNQSLASLAHTNSAQARLNVVGGSTATSRQNSDESNPGEVDEDETYDAIQSGELEVDFTDADGRVSDAAKAAAKVVKKAGKKGVRALVEDIESGVHATKDIVVGTARHCADGVEDTVDAAGDAVGSLVNTTFGIASRAFNQQPSIEEKPSNNVRISHPIDGAGQMVPMGMHIQPEIFKKGSGQKVLMVEPGKLADQAGLKENDVIIAIGDTDVTEKSLDEVLHIFGTISSTFSMTVVRRRLHLVLARHVITVEVHVNDDNAVAIKVLDVKCSKLAYQPQSAVNYRISHEDGSLRKFMKVIYNGTMRTLTMHSQATGPESEFQMTRYCPAFQSEECEVENHISLQNIIGNEAVAVAIRAEENNEHQVYLDDRTDDLMDDSINTVDFRFFYKHHPDANSSYLCCFESSEISTRESSENSTTGKFLAVVDGSVRVESYSYNQIDETIPSRFRFLLVDP